VAAAATKERIAPRVGGAEVEHVNLALGSRIPQPAVPQRGIAQLKVLAGDPQSSQLGRAGAVDRHRGGELPNQLVGRLEPLRAGVLRAQCDRSCALCRVWQPPWVAPGAELVRNHDIDVPVFKRRELVEGEVDRMAC